MTTTTNATPQFENRVTISGYASKSEVELKTFKDRKTGEDYQAYSGRLTIRTAEHESTTVQVFTREFKADGTENKIFKSMDTLFNKLVTLEDVSQFEGEEEDAPEASKVYCFANLDLNEYFREGQLTSTVQPRAITLSTAKAEKFEPHASFEVECVIIKVVDEFKQGEETGRKIVHVLHPTYNGSIPFEMVVEEGEGAEYVEENFEPGASASIFGDIVNYSKKVEGGDSKGGWGKAKAKPTWDNKRELVLNGGIIMDEENPKTLDVDTIKVLQGKRNQFLAALEERSQNSGEDKQENLNKKKGFSGGKTAPKPKTVEEKKEALTGDSTPAPKKKKADLGSLF